MLHISHHVCFNSTALNIRPLAVYLAGLTMYVDLQILYNKQTFFLLLVSYTSAIGPLFYFLLLLSFYNLYLIR